MSLHDGPALRRGVSTQLMRPEISNCTPIAALFALSLHVVHRACRLRWKATLQDRRCFVRRHAGSTEDCWRRLGKLSRRHYSCPFGASLRLHLYMYPASPLFDRASLRTKHFTMYKAPSKARTGFAVSLLHHTQPLQPHLPFRSNREKHYLTLVDSLGRRTVVRMLSKRCGDCRS